MRSTLLARAAPGAVLLVVLTSCASGVAVPPPDPAPVGAAAYACAALHGRLPDTVAGATVTATKPQSPLTSAWGSPAIVLRCGVGEPAALTATSQLVSIDGVDWFAEQLSAGYVFTTVGRVLNVEVSVPSAYEPAADALSDLSPTIAAMVPASASSPTPAAS